MSPPPLFEYLEVLLSEYFQLLLTRKSLPESFEASLFAKELNFNLVASERFLNALAHYGQVLKKDTFFSINHDYTRSKIHDKLFAEYRSFQRRLHAESSTWPFERELDEIKRFNDFSSSFAPKFYWILKYHVLVINQFFQTHVLDAAMATGLPQTKLALGIIAEQIFDNYKTNPALLESYAEGFAHATASNNLEIADHLNFLNSIDFLDIGGGNGSQAMAIASRNPQLTSVTVLDLPESEIALSASRKRWSDHFRYSPSWLYGNFFSDDFLESAENKKFGAISLSWILHDWDGDQCVQILKRARSLLTADGLIFVIEKVVRDLNVANVQDFIMMVMAGGFERNLSDYQELFLNANLNLERVIFNEKGRDLLILKAK